MKSAIILGLMSGTSLDGLDLCLTRFQLLGKQHKFHILKSKSVNYPQSWKEKLQSTTALSGEDLYLLDIELGIYFGNLVNKFLADSKVKPDYIASHGHTVFHQPEKGLTLQIGNGHQIFAVTGVPVIFDFRSLDVALKGQGAPLVPIGDLSLFSEYQACINFGGIANISFQKEGERLAHDICPVNMALSDVTSEIDLLYDDQGKIAEKGFINNELLKKLNMLNFYSETGPKSLGVEWYSNHFRPLIKQSSISIEDRLRTVIEHVSDQIAKTLRSIENGPVLVTGGGVYNSFLIEELKSKVSQKIVVPSKELVEFKEALIFAFLGWLRINDQVNVLKSVTGATSNSCSGLIIQ